MRIVGNIKSKRDRNSILLIFISVLIGIIYQSFQSRLSGNLCLALVILSAFLGYLGCFIFLSKHTLPSFSRRFLWISLYLFFVGLSYGTFYQIGTLSMSFVQDYRYIMFFLSGCIFAFSEELMNSFHSMMKVISVISVLFGLYAFVFFDFSYAAIATREMTWSLSYMLWWASCSCWVYWAYYGLFVRKDLLYAIGPTIVYTLLGLMFLKREVIVNAGVVLLVYLYFNRQHIRRAFTTGIVLVAVSVLLIAVAPNFYKNIFQMTLNRFSDVESVEDFDRQVEADRYLDEASIKQLVLGNGMGHYHIFKDSAVAEARGLLNALHLGYMNIFYKGGILFVFFYISMLRRLLLRIHKKNLTPYMQVCLGVTLSYFFSLFYAGSWTYTIAPFCLSAPLFYALNKNTGNNVV